jgi:hypothetical protein
MEKPTRARKRKLDTAKADLQPASCGFPGGQGVHREMESERHEEKCRAVIEGATPLIHPPHQCVCGRHGMEDLSMTPGGLAGFSGGTEISDLISESEVGSEVRRVVGRPNST